MTAHRPSMQPIHSTVAMHFNAEMIKYLQTTFWIDVTLQLT